MAEKEHRVIVSNRKARHDYEILETWEAGLMLTGTEVKSLRAGKANLLDAYALLKGGEVWLLGMHINPYEHGSYANHQPDRTRKVLLHARQILKLQGMVSERGLALIPLAVYFKGPYAKVELALARGKRQYDKRETIKRRDAEREMRQRTKRSAT
jgi:SsrA-binding protein